MRDLVDATFAACEALRDEMQNGDRIVVSVTMRCGCKYGYDEDVIERPGVAPSCKICRGTGYVIDARTFFPL